MKEIKYSINLATSCGFKWLGKEGFGAFWFTQENPGGNIYLDTECMSKDFIKKILCQLVDDAIEGQHPQNHDEPTNNNQNSN